MFKRIDFFLACMHVLHTTDQKVILTKQNIMGEVCVYVGNNHMPKYKYD